MVPGSFEAPELTAEPGNAGRILRVTVGVATLFFVTYYQTMQLRCLIASQTRPIAYGMDSLAVDIENGQSKLIMTSPTSSLTHEMLTSSEPSFTRLRQAIGSNLTRIQYEPDYSLMLQLVLEKYFWAHDAWCFCIFGHRGGVDSSYRHHFLVICWSCEIWNITAITQCNGRSKLSLNLVSHVFFNFTLQHWKSAFSLTKFIVRNISL